ncbi:CsbD family protein [Methylocapsa sp. S129]|uniref:CsbD family protein n=1 Tax=Methylocapsa sp. S129 TaxID=1641869 RepID=UPI00131EAAD0|nr:CsbD family protein [Methylocapsa sp. S129]
MSGTTDKIKGLGNEALGGAKRNLGEAVGSDKLQAEGIAQEIKGKAQKAVGDAKDAAKDAAKKIDDAANRNL